MSHTLHMTWSAALPGVTELHPDYKSQVTQWGAVSPSGWPWDSTLVTSDLEALLGTMCSVIGRTQCKMEMWDPLLKN